MIIDVPYISQTPKWPTGCESVSAVMVLNYYGVNITVDEFIQYLPTAPLEKSADQWYGSSPYTHFIGSPYDPDSFGCYSDVIASTINAIAKNRKLSLHCIDISTYTTDDIITGFIRHKNPVLYWSTIDLKPSFRGPCWKLTDPDHKQFTWISNEHCLVFIGADEDKLWFNDPWNNNGIISCQKAIADQRHREMLSMALAITED